MRASIRLMLGHAERDQSRRNGFGNNRRNNSSNPINSIISPLRCPPRALSISKSHDFPSAMLKQLEIVLLIFENYVQKFSKHQRRGYKVRLPCFGYPYLVTFYFLVVGNSFAFIAAIRNQRTIDICSTCDYGKFKL